jgi:endo-1,4-beta-xylanase
MQKPLAVLLVAAALALGALLAGCSDSGEPRSAPPPAEPARGCLAEPDSCTLREVGSEADFLVGAAIDSEWIRDPAYAAVLAHEFNSVTAEREMKWDVLQPRRGVFDFSAADELVAFAEDNDMEVRGHTLVWDQAYLDSTPEWVLAVTDPEELRAVLREHFSTVLDHFGTSVDRWDVLNEPLATAGSGWYENHFQRVLGPGYAAELFELAHELAPDASLWLNEAAVEYNPAKAEALYSAVEQMVAEGVPIDGVGLQGHLLAGAPEKQFVGELISGLRGLGLEVAITEMDVPVEAGTAGEYSAQAAAYEQMVTECMDAGCGELTMWGVHDEQTWLDGFLGRDDTDPLLFDDQLVPKSAHAATKAAIARAAA